MVHLLRKAWSAVVGAVRSGRSRKEWDALAAERNFDRKRFASRLRYHPRHWDLFFEALLHRSLLPRIDARAMSNERLEFLGDAVLGFLVADYLHRLHPGMEEGDLTKLRSRLVNRRILAQRARTMELENFLFVSPSAREALQRGSESILSDAFEALVGAVYRDGGISAARTFVYEHLLSPEQVMNGAMSDDNYKSALLELSQRHARGVPRYETVGEEGPDHDRRFTVRVYLGTHCLGQGAGRSKKEAEQAAAFQGFRRLQQELAPHGKTQQP